MTDVDLPVRPLSVAEIQAAVLAARQQPVPAPLDDDTPHSPDGAAAPARPTTVPAVSDHIDRIQGARSSTHDGPGAHGLPLPALVVVASVHANEGATTVALAIAESAAGASGATVTVDEFAPPSRSGLVAAADAELGTDASDRWLVGRRGLVTLRRLAHEHGHQGPIMPGGLTVANPSQPWPDLPRTADGRIDVFGRAVPLVLVCRASRPSLQRAEALLDGPAAGCGRPLALAVLGPARWPGALTATVGPRVRALRDAGRVVPFPFDKHLAVRGVTADPLRRDLVMAGRSLLTLLHTPAESSPPIGEAHQ